METTEPRWDEEKTKQKYLNISKILFLFAILYTLWIALLIIGAIYLELGPKWAALTIEQWTLTGIFLIAIIIGIESILLLHYSLLRRKQLQPEQPLQPVYLQGKQVYSYTVPDDAKGGIFSKTYIMIDDCRVLNLRYQMILPNELWGQKQ